VTRSRPAILDRSVRVAATAFHRLLRLAWFVRRPRTFGAHALALTAGRKIILVKLRYAPGWRLPGAAGPSRRTRATRCCASFARRSE